ncbi:MAG TPA: AGE family epimerase/isomerase [Algoriphagus sp.]|nr:AGE family epimerase/isomerase [Algoriphagus sp.]
MKLKITGFFIVLALFASCQTEEKSESTSGNYLSIADEMEISLRENLLNTWYPKAIDQDSGGYFSNFTFDFQIKDDLQEKMIVTQSRHLWSNSKAAKRYPNETHYAEGAKHGFVFLRDKMWDQENGGFYQLVSRSGQPLLDKSEYKTAYGNSFAIYSLAAYFDATGDSAGLELAIEAFNWLEKNSHDPVHKGYFQHLDQDGTPVVRPADTPSTSELGYKDQNSSIHLLEAFTELYLVWKDPLLKERLEEMLLLVRDTITNDKGSLVLFFQTDWTPVSFQDQSEEVIMKHKGLDHVSYGHDVETAYLILESSHVLGWEDDSVTLTKAKKMVDHALSFGWDNDLAGFFDEAYYFTGEEKPRVIKDTKNWWAQSEGMNTLLLMAEHFPQDERDYFGKFEQLWQYNQDYLIDHEHGDWFSGGLDKQPDLKTADKGHIWKANYHQFRSMQGCIERLRNWDDGKE